MGVFNPICIVPTAAQLELARYRQQQYFQVFKDRGTDVPRDSLRDGRGHFAGSLGEIVKHDYLNELAGYELLTWPVTYQEIINWDMRNTISGLTFDAKTKERTQEPWSHYYCSVPAYNIEQKCDYYSFISTSENFRYVWLLGFISKKHFFAPGVAKKAKKGEYDDTSPPHRPFYFKCDCYNVRADQLTPFPAKRAVPRFSELTY